MTAYFFSNYLNGWPGLPLAAEGVAYMRATTATLAGVVFMLAAVIRRGELMIPKGDTVLKTADEVLAVVGQAGLAQFASILESAI